MSWWPFRRRLDPIKDETRRHDEQIRDLAQIVAEEQEAAQESHRRLQRAIADMGDQFAVTAEQVARRVVGPNRRGF